MEPCKMKKNSVPESSKRINYKMISDFALSYEITDCCNLMHEYAHLSNGCDRNPAEITPEHESNHIEHKENAQIFVHLSDPKRCANSAVETVFAKLYTELHRETNTDFLNRRCKDIGNYTLDNYSTDEIGRAWYYCDEVIEQFEVISRRILGTFMHGKPRKISVLEREIISTATWRFSKEKNQQPIAQVFPCGIITCNHFHIHVSHDCPFSSGSCRCRWRNNGDVRMCLKKFIRRPKYINPFDWVNILIYFYLSKRSGEEKYGLTEEFRVVMKIYDGKYCAKDPEKFWRGKEKEFDVTLNRRHPVMKEINKVFLQVYDHLQDLRVSAKQHPFC
ncbi:Large T antigen like protein [Argiope bruennichi]|uniref:Large T antigen like protein n=1 Tax=Argiope bruennichi TaxID=94029 RepID=A0A8T0FEK0_ARGBR|nr:Large T antigen like protein [Argiope bruennichi]